MNNVLKITFTNNSYYIIKRFENKCNMYCEY